MSQIAWKDQYEHRHRESSQITIDIVKHIIYSKLYGETSVLIKNKTDKNQTFRT